MFVACAWRHRRWAPVLAGGVRATGLLVAAGQLGPAANVVGPTWLVTYVWVSALQTALAAGSVRITHPLSHVGSQT
eukprot:792906-Amphidinium_carterae.1